MQIHSVALTNFMSHDRARLMIPATGALVITGPNGAGKSAFVEAVAWAFWGKTLRGHKPWRDGEACEVCVISPGLRVTRSRSDRGKLSLAWEVDGEAPDVFDTVTKAQEALAAHIPTFEAWRQTHVLTSADSSRFTLATDAERKRLLEEVLGVEGIDAARNAAKGDLGEARGDERAASAHLSGLTASHAQAQAALDALDAPTTVSDAAHTTALGVQALHAEGLHEAREDIRRIEDDIKLTISEIATHRALRRTIDERRARVSVNKCPTCEQAIQPAHRDRLTKALHEQQTDLDGRLDDALADKGHAEAVLDEVREAVREANREHAEAVGIIDTYRREQKAHRDSAARRGHLAKILADNAAAAAQHTSERDAAQQRQKVLSAVVDLFGARGFRGHLLASSVAGLQTLTNRWLDILAPALALGLSIDPRGSVRIDLDGAANGQGYMGASSGERRRVDVALTLALCELASAASGADEGTLWLDEVFDSLDPAGISGVSSAVSTLSATRGTILITHNAEVAALPTATRLELGIANHASQENNGVESETPER